MHSGIFDIIEYMKSAHPKNEVRLTTNGVLLKESTARRLIELKVDQVRIGIRAATQETYFKIHKHDHFDRVKANVEHLLQLKREMRAALPMVIVQIIVCQDTSGEIDLFRQQWGDKDVFMEIKDFMSWGGWTADPTLPQHNNTGDPRRSPCIDPFHNLVVNWDGKVSLCSLDWNTTVPLGDVGKQDVLQLWHGEPAKAVREAHLKGNFKQNSMCANCQEWRYVPNLFWKNRLAFWKDHKWL
jgi:radical SAM protein with 4Fe4S-binding SPASM domain